MVGLRASKAAREKKCCWPCSRQTRQRSQHTRHQEGLNPMNMEEYVQKLRTRKARAAGSEKDAETQHKKGRLTAHERIALLFDPGSFNEIDTLVLPRYETYMGGKASRFGDGVVTGFGLINGRRVFAAAQ